MANRFLSVAFWVVLVSAFVVTGCEQGYVEKEEEEVVVHSPLTDPNSVLPDYASRAIEASGGISAWARTKQIRGDCVVTFYKPDDSFYLTEQHHEIHPCSNLIRISAREPRGEFVWELSGGQFSISKSGKRIDALPVSVGERNFAEAVLNIATAPVRFAEEPVGSAGRSKLVKAEGRWYYPIKRRESVFYQNRDSLLVDMIWFDNVDVESGGGLVVRGYNYVEVEKGGVLVPTKIEIFRTGASGILKKRLIKIDYRTLKSTE